MKILIRTYLKITFMLPNRGRDGRSHEENNLNCGSGGPRRDFCSNKIFVRKILR